LHAVGEFVGRDAAGDFGVVDIGELAFIEIAEGVQPGPLHLHGEALGIIEIEDRFTLIAEEDSLISGGEKTAGPERGTAAGAATGGEDDITGEVVGFAAEPVVEPSSHARTSEGGSAGVHQQLTGVMIESIGVHGADHAEVVGTGGDVGEEVGKFHAAFAVLLEFARTSENDGGLFLDECEADVFRE